MMGIKENNLQTTSFFLDMELTLSDRMLEEVSIMYKSQEGWLYDI